MAGKRLTYEIDLETRQAVRGLKDMAKESGKVEDGFDDTRTAGQKMADAIKQRTAAAHTEIDETARAAKALEKALGPDFKGDTKDVVANLKRVGLTADDIEQDVDELAAAIRGVDGVKVHAVEAGFDDVGQAVGGVQDDVGRTGDAMSGFVGGTVGELPLINEAMGPVAEGLGQLTEGALGGEVAFKQLLGAGLAMGGVALAVKGVADWMEKQAAIEAFKEEQVDAYREALEETDDVLEGVVSKLEDAGSVEVNLFGDAADITGELVAAGLSMDQFARLVAGGEAKLAEWVRTADAAGVSSEHLELVQLAARSETKALGDAQHAAAVNNEFFALTQQQVNDELDRFLAQKDPIGEYPDEFDRIAKALADGTKPSVEDLTTVTDGLNITVQDAIAYADDLNGELEDEADALDEVAGAAGRAEDGISDLRSQYDTLKTSLSDRSAYLAVEDAFDGVEDAGRKAMEASAEGGAEAEAAMNDFEQAQIRAKEAVIKYAEEVGNLPPERVTELLAEIDEGNLAAVEAKLARLEQVRIAKLEIHGTYIPPAGYVPGDYRARGGNTGSRGAVVAEHGRPELVDGNLVTSPTAVGAGRSVTGEAETRRRLSGRSVTTNVTNINVGPGYTPSEIDRIKRRYERQAGR
jgi:uncharacterized phage infection (PIP) family protein YhgE